MRWAAVMALLLAAVPAGAGWEVGTVAAPAFFQDMDEGCSAVDPSGVLHVAYGSDHLYHGWMDGTVWQSEVVDPSPGVGAGASLAIAADGTLHVAYSDEFGGNLKYASRSGGSWTIAVLDDDFEGNYRISLALDTGGAPCICYWDPDAGQIWLARSYGMNFWHFDLVADPAYLVGDVSLAMDGDRPHMAMSIQDGGLMKIYYMYYDGSDWQFLGPLDEGGFDLSLALDGSGQANVAYQGKPPEGLMFLRFVPGGFPGVPVSVDPGSGPGQDCSLRLESELHPRIAYRDDAAGSLKYAYHNGTTWVVETALDGRDAGRFTSLNLDGGQPRVIHQVETGTLVHSDFDGVSWTHRDLEQAELLAFPTGLALDSGGRPHCFYESLGLKSPFWAYDPGLGWDSRIIDPGIEPFIVVGATLDRQDRPRLAAITLSGGFHYLEHGSTGWSAEPITPDPVLVIRACLRLDSLDRPHLAFLEDTSHELRYAVRDGSSWSVETVYSDAAEAISMVLDANDLPRIAYYEGTDHDLRYAEWTGSGWHQGAVDSAGDVGDHCSLDLDSLGRPHIAYRDNDHSALKYARHDGVGWVLQTVDSGGNMGREASLALDSLDRPHIGYLDGDDALRYGWYDGLFWQYEVLDSQGDVGQRCQLVLDAFERPYLVYGDLSNKDIKYARYRPEIWYDLIMPDILLEPAESFRLLVQAGNETGSPQPVDEYIVLDLAGEYWFGPGWSQQVDRWTWTLAPGAIDPTPILAFSWPSGAGSMDGIRFWGALLTAGSVDDLIVYDWIDWGFQE